VTSARTPIGHFAQARMTSLSAAGGWTSNSKWHFSNASQKR